MEYALAHPYLTAVLIFIFIRSSTGLLHWPFRLATYWLRQEALRCMDGHQTISMPTVMSSEGRNPLGVNPLRADVTWIVNGRRLREMTLREALQCVLALRTGEELDFFPVLHEERLFVDIGAFVDSDQPST